ncbi:hypothetical protein MTO96_036993, partial [Rhipicephalus appendiculatus]
CDEKKLGKSCWSGCKCRVLKKLKTPLYMCFEDGKTLPIGFEDS